MSYKLFLDDYRQPIDCVSYMHKRIGKENPVYLEKDWIIAKSYEEFVAIIEKDGLPDLVSFDHDLADEHYSFGLAGEDEWLKYHFDPNHEKTGYDCALWLWTYCVLNKKSIPKYYIHTMNPVGLTNIKSALR